MLNLICRSAFIIFFAKISAHLLVLRSCD